MKSAEQIPADQTLAIYLFLALNPSFPTHIYFLRTSVKQLNYWDFPGKEKKYYH